MLMQASPRPRDLYGPGASSGEYPRRIAVCLLVLETWRTRWAPLRPGRSSARPDEDGTARRRRPPGHPSRVCWFKNSEASRARQGSTSKRVLLLPPSSRRAVLKQLIQDGIESRRLMIQLPRLALLACALLEQLVGNVEGGEDGDLGRRDPGQTPGD